MTLHHHQPGRAHPSPKLAVSILRLSALQRLVVVAFLSAALWLAVMATVWH